jgi:hypothetical protein
MHDTSTCIHTATCSSQRPRRGEPQAGGGCGRAARRSELATKHRHRHRRRRYRQSMCMPCRLCGHAGGPDSVSKRLSQATWGLACEWTKGALHASWVLDSPGPEAPLPLAIHLPKHHQGPRRPARNNTLRLYVRRERATLLVCQPRPAANPSWGPFNGDPLRLRCCSSPTSTTQPDCVAT